MRSISIRYIAVIVCGWIVDNVVFLLVVGLIGIPLAVLAGRIAGASTGYALHRTVTFPERTPGERSRRKEIVVYVCVWLAAYFITASGAVLLVDRYGIPPLLAKVAIESIVVPTNFILLSRYAFR